MVEGDPNYLVCDAVAAPAVKFNSRPFGMAKVWLK
jgi:hypothetical protein